MSVRVAGQDGFHVVDLTNNLVRKVTHRDAYCVLSIDDLNVIWVGADSSIDIFDAHTYTQIASMPLPRGVRVQSFLRISAEYVWAVGGGGSMVDVGL